MLPFCCRRMCSKFEGFDSILGAVSTLFSESTSIQMRVSKAIIGVVWFELTNTRVSDLASSNLNETVGLQT